LYENAKDFFLSNSFIAKTTSVLLKKLFCNIFPN
jgi:hypothetical protein